MKIRIKKTGEIKTVVDYARIEVEDCDSYGNPQGFKLDEVELINDDKGVNFPMTDWNQVRIQAAIAAMQGILSNPKLLEDISEATKMTNNRDETIITASCCIVYADELVEQLKKKEYESK